MKKKSKVIIVSMVSALLLVLILGIYLFFYFKESQVKLKKNVIEINTNISIKDIVTTKNGKLISSNSSIDTSKLGKKTIKIAVKNSLGRKKVYPLVITIKDTKSPQITFSKELSTTVGTEISLLNDVKVEDNSKEELKVKVEGEYSFARAGDYTLEYVCTDSSGNEAREKFTLKVLKALSNSSNESKESKAKTSKGYSIVRKEGLTYIEGVLIVNKTYSLPSTYGNGLTKETINAFQTMKQAALEEGITINIISGYRSFSRQTTLYNNYVSRDGKEKADTYSARPGHSEHQSGLAFDLNSLETSFANTKEGKWLYDRAAQYGFILRYPKGKTNETGYIYEPWHFRYVGVELAKKLYHNDQWTTLEDYFGISSSY